MELGAQFSGAHQGVRYRGNGGQGTLLLTEPRDNNEPGQMALFNDRSLRTIHAESVEYGHTAAPRPHDPTQWNGQQAFRGMPRPTDPALHRLRQSNPSLNDYQFKVNQRAGDTPHGVTARDREGRRVGHLDLGYERMSFEPHPGHREVSGIGVAPDHAGKGLGEAMYDLARMKGSKIVHSDERSESGEAFSRRVGGPALPRRRGHGYDDYLGLNPPSDRV